MKRLKIEALAKSVPEMRVSNDDLAEFIETSDEWISQRTGIKNRRVSLFDNTSDLCAKAAKELLSGWEELSCEEPSREVKRAPQPVREAAKRSPVSRAVKRFIGSILS